MQSQAPQPKDHVAAVTPDGGCSWHSMARMIGMQVRKTGALPFDVTSPTGKVFMNMVAKAHPELNLSENPHLAGTQVLQTLAGHQTGKQDEALLSRALLATWSLQEQAGEDPSTEAIKAFKVNGPSLGTYREQGIFLDMAERFDWGFSLLDAGQSGAVMTNLAQASREDRPHLAVKYQPSPRSGRQYGHFDLLVHKEEVEAALPLTTPSPSPKPTPRVKRKGLSINTSPAYSQAEQAAKVHPSQSASIQYAGITENLDVKQQQAFDALLAQVVQQAWSNPETSNLSFDQIRANVVDQLITASATHAKTAVGSPQPWMTASSMAVAGSNSAADLESRHGEAPR